MLTREDSETKFSNTRFHQNRLNRFYQPWAQDSVRWLGPKLGSLRIRIVVRLDSGLVSRLDFARGSSRFAQGPAQLESLLIIGRGSGSVRLGSIRYLGLGSSRLVAWARLGTRLGTRKSAQCSARPKSELGLGSDRGPAHQLGIDSGLGTRDST